VLISSTSTNWKYWSMDHNDSTAPSAYSTKNLSAAGVRISYANRSLPTRIRHCQRHTTQPHVVSHPSARQTNCDQVPGWQQCWIVQASSLCRSQRGLD